LVFYLSQFFIALAVFTGAAVSGFTGFAFSAVAGAILLHMLAPTEAVPLMMTCSIVVQGANIFGLRRSLNWRGASAFIAGGVLGLPPSLYLLFHVDAPALRKGFGALLAAYSAWMLLRPATRHFVGAESKVHDGMVGFAGGLVGGLTAMPGALPALWCDLRGLPKEEQRGLVQPFIAAMQVLALIILIVRNEISFGFLNELVISVPAVVAGAALGLTLFNRVDGSAFRKAMFLALLASGLALAA
jgi:uncharacterized protein